ncbi:Rrf2 family transcriptional regulator [Roseovarius spongiae]|uniref:Rrf2 family transcriptional regulator n=1 Tax=Roseovarius spongiae TaxID=2320272 RepID=A0A3A8B4Y3_9RHOB|nr:Rrf2 family transcriptional regulator [Roseovarius spongiae]RKF13959.1 Rrf2 family transcriptional regulator [Roseovarius spongiae]
MRLATFTDYGLRILMRLASTPEERLSTADLAAQFEVSQHHLTKVVQDLVRGGFIETRRGSGGGMRLARDPAEIGLGSVVRHLERRFALVECCQANGGNCVLKPRCRLKPRLLAAQDAFLAELDRSTVADCAWNDDAAAA